MMLFIMRYQLGSLGNLDVEITGEILTLPQHQVAQTLRYVFAQR